MKAAMEDPANFMTKVGNYYEGLKAGFVDVSPLTANCTAETKEAIDLAKDLMTSGEWDVFSGAAGSVGVAKTDAALKTNDGTEIVAAGGKSVEDGVIQGSMNYYVEGVTQVN